VLAFQAVVRRSLPCFIRKPRGQDVLAACGQLAGEKGDRGIFLGKMPLSPFS